MDMGTGVQFAKYAYAPTHCAREAVNAALAL
jgi:hypothetical protein